MARRLRSRRFSGAGLNNTPYTSDIIQKNEDMLGELNLLRISSVVRRKILKGAITMENVKTGLLAFLGIIVTMGAVWFDSQNVPPKIATPDDVLTEARQGGYRLISTDELWERYKTDPENLFLADTRQEWEYRTGHIRGAVNFPIEPGWWSEWRKKSVLEIFLGPDREQYIVFY